jgi:uncharacterized DUF497 family protein
MYRNFRWNEEKNEHLKRVRGIGFEEIVFHLENGGLLAMIDHPRPEVYPNQRIFAVAVNGYAYMVPFVWDGDVCFLKTIIPSRKATKRYLRGDS